MLSPIYCFQKYYPEEDRLEGLAIFLLPRVGTDIPHITRTGADPVPPCTRDYKTFHCVFVVVCLMTTTTSKDFHITNASIGNSHTLYNALLLFPAKSDYTYSPTFLRDTNSPKYLHSSLYHIVLNLPMICFKTQIEVLKYAGCFQSSFESYPQKYKCKRDPPKMSHSSADSTPPPLRQMEATFGEHHILDSILTAACYFGTLATQSNDTRVTILPNLIKLKDLLNSHRGLYRTASDKDTSTRMTKNESDSSSKNRSRRTSARAH